jgi:CheY-like chemotaxis protein
MQKGISLARKILLADDSVTAQNMGRKILADAGYEVVTVNNGSAALKKIAELRPDLIVLDVYMPGYSGLEVCQRLKDAQETARIPVLLTVGKLEPFKAEEAQRVRADAFIVKPFEASELLTALSKLEDKILPRGEAKGGRYTRFAAPADGLGRNREASSGGDSSWKERIAVPDPQKKAEAETDQKPQDETALYNPMNRDLRTVVDKAAAEKETKPLAAAEATVNVSSAVPEGLPKDVTPEELAAIAAAMAQMQSTLAHAQQGPQPAAEEGSTHATASEAKEKSAAVSQVATSPEADAADAARAPGLSQALENTAKESDTTSEKHAAEPVSAPSVVAVSAEVSEEIPATMAASAGMSTVSAQGPCWMAVPVALGADEAAISLEREMQQAYAAFAAADADSPASPQQLPAADGAAQLSAATNSMPEPIGAASLPEPDRAISLSAAASTLAPVAEADRASAVAWPTEGGRTTSPPPAPTWVAPASTPEVHRAVTSFDVVAEPDGGSRLEKQEPAQQERNEQPSALALATATVGTPYAPEPAPVSEAGSKTANTLATASLDAPVSEPHPQEELDTVASTAAAWASWRQIRDSGEAQKQAPPAPAFEMTFPVTAETATRAVAAGAEQVDRQTSAPAPGENSADVASIVESVLADLRPKLMEEISKKLAGEKR